MFKFVFQTKNKINSIVHLLKTKLKLEYENEISKKYENIGLPDDTINLCFYGSAGQSFGAFGASGITFNLEGNTNDYLGKGLSGAKIIVKKPKESSFKAEENIITGNVLSLIHI